MSDYATDTSEDLKEEITEEEEIPLKVEITNKEIEKNPTSYDTIDEWDIEPSDEEIKEMQDAQ